MVVAAFVCATLSPCGLIAQATPIKLRVAISVEAKDQHLREAARTALASELRHLGDVTEVDSVGDSWIALEAVAVGTVDHYAIWIEANAQPLIVNVNLFYVTLHADENGNINAKDLSAYLGRINDLVKRGGGTIYRGEGRETLRDQCAAAVTHADNDLLKLVRQQLAQDAYK